MKKLFLLLILCQLILSIGNRVACAAFSIAVTPYEGGYDLRYGKVSFPGSRINKEVAINITSDTGKQYRLIQNVLEPLTNATGVSIPQKNFMVYGIRGSNRYGTLGVEQERPVTLGRTYIYTSNQTGLPDSFTLVYGLEGPFDVPPGMYRGRLSFTLEAVETIQAPVTVVLDISAEIDIESKIEIKTITGSRMISLNPRKEGQESADIEVSIQGGLGNQFKIVQMMSEQPISPEGNKLPEDTLNCQVKEITKGTGLLRPANLSLRPLTVYTSGISGEPETFIITVKAGNLDNQKAGHYRTSLKYLLEGSGFIKEGLIDTLSLEIENEKVFELIINPEMGGVIRFQNLKAGSPSQTNEVAVSVNSNIGKQYQVTQKIASPFTNKEGDIIPVKYFTLKQESLDTKGVLKYSRKTENTVGDMVLFISDAEGNSDNFKVIYELAVPPDLKAGDYSTNITYSLSEI